MALTATTIQIAVLGRFTGPAYVFGPDPVQVFGPKDDYSVVLTSIINILTTRKRTVPYAPGMGSFIPDMLFELNDEVTRNLIRYYTLKDLTDQEPRIVVLACYTQQADEHTIVVTVAFQIVGDSTGRVYSAPITFKNKLGTS